MEISYQPGKNEQEREAPGSAIPVLFQERAAIIHWLCLGYYVVMAPNDFEQDGELDLSAERLASRTVMTLAALIAAGAVCQATQTGARFTALSTPSEAVRTVLQLLGDSLLTPYYAWSSAETVNLGYQATPENMKLLADCPSISSFKQTPWLRSPYMCFAALSVRDYLGTPSTEAKRRKMVRREKLVAPDGGVLALDWWEESAQMTKTKKVKRVLFIGSTFTGDAFVTCTREVCRYYSARGWRCVVFVKRGCGLTSPNSQPDAQAAPWCLSGLADTSLAIDHVAKKYPGVPICGLGLSTGAGQLRNYVNIMGKASKLSAAVIVDAGPDWTQGINMLEKKAPALQKILGSVAQVSFKECGRGALAKKDSFEKLLPGGMLEFVRDWMAPAHGFEHSDEGALAYLDSCRPAPASGCKVPCLEVLTINDSLVAPELVAQQQDVYKESPHVITATTVEGTHVVRWDGWRPQCWVSRSSCEFLEAALKASPTAVSRSRKK